MSSPASLRDLYASPPNTWSFAPPPANGSDASAVSPPASGSYQWSARPAPDSLLGLSAGLEDDEGLDVKALAVGLVTSGLLQYATTAIAVPWEVGRTLLQVQWIPRDIEDLPARDFATAPKESEEEEELSEEEASYFADPQTLEQYPPPPRATDEKGYVIRQSITDDDGTQDYIIPVGSASGPVDMMCRLKSFQPEGWLALWKGLLTTTVSEILSGGLQPLIRSLLEGMFTSNLDGSPTSLFRPLLIPLASQVLSGFILSPLDLVRTRLVVQSSRYPTYNGPVDALRKILRHEGGIWGAYFHPHLFLPTILDNTLRSVGPFLLPGLVMNYMSVSPEAYPFLWSCVEFVGNFAGLLVSLPFETVRRRLQVQVRGTAKPFRTCVEVRPVPYNGMVDAFWHIITEERSDIPIQTKRHRRKSHGAKGRVEEIVEKKESWLRNTGIGQLYRGLGLRMTGNIVVFVLGLMSGRDEPDAGWAEL